MQRSFILHVSGMTKFQLSGVVVLGLIPEKGIKRPLGAVIEDPERTNGIARAEIYLTAKTPEISLERALTPGGRFLSPLEPRKWGDAAGYVADPDGHIVAFVSRT